MRPPIRNIKDSHEALRAEAIGNVKHPVDANVVLYPGDGAIQADNCYRVDHSAIAIFVT